jgi:hypothetical protein
MPTTLLGPTPRAGAGEAERHAAYLPRDLALSQWAFFYEQTRLHENHFGSYPRDCFDDERVEPLTARFRAALDAVDARIVERNAGRPVAYEWLRPAHTRASVHS